MSPERYVALNAHGWFAATIFTVKFADPEMDAWIRRAGELLFDWRNLDALRREWLSPEELEHVKRRKQQQQQQQSPEGS